VEKASSRLRVLALLVALMFVALTARLWFLQVLASPQFARDARDNRLMFVTTNPLRGRIVDASGDPIVGNQGSLEVRVNRQELGEEGEAVVVHLADLLGVEVSTLRERLQDPRYLPNQPIPVAEFIETKPSKPGVTPFGERVALFISEHQRRFPGVTVEPVSVRAYPYQRLAAHVLGFVGQVTAEDLEGLDDKHDYGLNDVIGRAGLEREYEKYLRGEPGVQKFIVNADGEILRALAAIEPTAGGDLHLTLEIDEQLAAERALAEGIERARTLEDSDDHALRANSGVVIVLDAKTGGVRAMASLPSFNPAWYTKGLSPMQVDYLSNAQLAPSLNRALQGYIPGSTFKPITALAAIGEGIASTVGSYLCSTTYVHPGDESGTEFTNWASSERYMNVAEALRVSCDTVFYRFGSAFYDRYVQNQLSADAQRLPALLGDWGFGEPTGVDVGGETSGLVPNPEWAREAKDVNGDPLFPYGWVPGIDILTMIGADYPSVTPLQLARAYAAIANGGHLCRPHLVDQIVGPNGKLMKDVADRCEQRLPYTGAQLQYIRTALLQVPASGTADCAFAGFPLSTVPVMGKTGTAERPPFQDTSWFAAMVGPTGAPEYVVVAMVEQGGFGGQVAAPIARQVIEEIEGLTPEQSPHLGCPVLEEDR
jgi:penicillin-binding protein 2